MHPGPGTDAPHAARHRVYGAAYKTCSCVSEASSGGMLPERLVLLRYLRERAGAVSRCTRRRHGRLTIARPMHVLYVAMCRAPCDAPTMWASRCGRGLRWRAAGGVHVLVPGGNGRACHATYTARPVKVPSHSPWYWSLEQTVPPCTLDSKPPSTKSDSRALQAPAEVLTLRVRRRWKRSPPAMPPLVFGAATLTWRTRRTRPSGATAAPVRGSAVLGESEVAMQGVRSRPPACSVTAVAPSHTSERTCVVAASSDERIREGRERTSKEQSGREAFGGGAECVGGWTA